MPEPTMQHVQGLAKSGIWGAGKADQLIAISAEAVGTFIDELPIEHRELAIGSLNARIEQSKQQLQETKDSPS